MITVIKIAVRESDHAQNHDLSYRGLLVLGAGRNSIRLAPPLVISRDQADFAVSTLEEIIAEVSRGR